MNYPFRFLMALLVIAISAFPSSLSAVVTNVSNVAELVGALKYLNSISTSRENTIVLAKGEYDVSGIKMKETYGAVDFSEKYSHLALNCVTLLGATENPRDTVIFGHGAPEEVEAKGLRVICGRNSAIRNLTVSNGWINAAPGGGYAAYTAKQQGSSTMTEMVSNCVVTCCYAWKNWGGGSAISSVEAYDSEICGNTTGEENCFGAADMCNLYRCFVHSNHAQGGGGGLGRCFAYDCIISNNTSVKSGAGMRIASPNSNYAYLLSGCTVVDNRSSDIGGGISTDRNAPGSVTNTVVCGNSAYGQAGGVFGALCVDCVISNNIVQASNSGNTSKGGGVSYAKIVDSDICFNLLESGGNASMGSAYGGGASESVLEDCNVFGNAICSGYNLKQGAGVWGCTATNCVIYENFIDASGLGAAMNGGSAYGCVFSNNQTRATNRESPHIRQPTGTVVNCTFYGQTIACSTKIVVENCRFTGCRDGWTIPAGHNIASMTEDLTSDIPGSDYLASAYMHMRNCLIDNNSIKYISKANSTDLSTFENCTFADNRVDQIFFNYCGESFLTNAASVVNCIFTGNYDKTGTTRCDLSFKDGTNVSLENCLVGTSRSDGVLYSETGTVTADNVCFNRKNPAHPYEPKYSSPARGAGKPLDWMTADATDIRADPAYPRLREGKVDIGCYQCWLDPVGFVMSVK